MVKRSARKVDTVGSPDPRCHVCAARRQRIWDFLNRCYEKDFQVRLTPEIAADISTLLERDEI
jgi:hypothetical protein